MTTEAITHETLAAELGLPSDGPTRTTRTPASATQARRSGCSSRRRRCSSARSSRRTSCTAAATPTSTTRAWPSRSRPTVCFNIPFTSVTSFMLLMSSLTMVLALAAIQRGDHRRLRIWLLATALFGADVHRRSGLRVHRVLPARACTSSTNMFGTTFFVLTGLHGAHVTIGIIWLLLLWGRSVQGTPRPRRSTKPSRSRVCTGTSSTSCGSSSSPRST